ncbi:hypothetical protein L3X38_026155 [Prunus dulcis]|uniref:Uncharacterized protein n=1 Tax=Prunus dulcis TaxID=3755 RepID=A0AAD4Z824_PRUDU|nr:hypothetical protein L3X38_026155 [Prunus dulcis]
MLSICLLKCHTHVGYEMVVLHFLILILATIWAFETMVVLSHIIGHESLQPLSWISLITSSAYSENGNCPLHKESDWKEAGYHDHGGILLAEELKG